MDNLILDVRNKLNNLSSLKFKNFSMGIVKNKHPMIGVSIPALRSLAKEIAKTDAVEFLNNNPMEFYEEVLLYGFVVGYSKFDVAKKLNYLSKFIPFISDWSECDSVVSTLKFINNSKADVYNFLSDYFLKESEFEKRFAIVCYLNYFITDDYVGDVLEKLVNVKSDKYYVNMSVAWALSVCFVKYFNQTLNVFKNCNLDDFTFNKTISKCAESFRITPKQKQLLKTLKRK